jgi:hypothetical protein
MRWSAWADTASTWDGVQPPAAASAPTARPAPSPSPSVSGAGASRDAAPAPRTPAEELRARRPHASSEVLVRERSASKGTRGLRARACWLCMVGRGTTYPALSTMTALPARCSPLDKGEKAARAARATPHRTVTHETRQTKC